MEKVLISLETGIYIGMLAMVALIVVIAWMFYSEHR